MDPGDGRLTVKLVLVGWQIGRHVEHSLSVLVANLPRGKGPSICEWQQGVRTGDDDGLPLLFF